MSPVLQRVMDANSKLMYGLALSYTKDCLGIRLSPPHSVEVFYPWSSVKSCHQGKQAVQENEENPFYLVLKTNPDAAPPHPHCDTVTLPTLIHKLHELSL